jgi:oligopeptide/dipeptide ABC transporter ATP-binding protein
MSNMMAVKHLDLAFEQHNRILYAVDDLNFEIAPGETLALLGESGSGKSLTSLALMRLLPRDAVYGAQAEVLLGEEDLLQLPERLMRRRRGRRIAMIFQEPMTALNPVLTIGQQLAESLHREAGRTKLLLRQQMIQLLTEVEMSEPMARLDQYPHQLSGGQKQRVVIAMALAGHPELLIADEPTTALDATTQSQILSLLKRLQKRYQMSILFISHDINVVRFMADRVCVMYAGQVVELAPLLPFIDSPKHPYAQQLFMSLPSFAKRGERLQAIRGTVPTLDARPTGCRFHPRCAHAFELCQSKMPAMQTLSDGRVVRCHLYPQLSHPPALPETKESWTSSHHQDEVIMAVRDLKVYFYPKQSILSRHRPPFKAVDGLSFELHKGKTLALVGESGCGKSTVCKALLRLIPITSGSIDFKGTDMLHLHGRALKQFRQNVQIIFQDPFSSMNPRMTISEILAEGMVAQNMPRKVIQRRLSILLDQVNLSQTSLTRYPHQFSGGQRQRICIARALATEPDVLICDEPTSALDISVQAQILNLLKSLQHELGLSYLFITHNMSVVSYIADEVLVMQNGRAIETGTCEQILTSPSQAYTKLLLKSAGE